MRPDAISVTPSEAAHVLVVVYAKSLPAVAAFYERALQLERIEVDPAYILLSNGITQVTVVQAPDAIASKITATAPPVLREDTPLKTSTRHSQSECNRSGKPGQR